MVKFIICYKQIAESPYVSKLSVNQQECGFLKFIELFFETDGLGHPKA